MSQGPIRVLIADDSHAYRSLLTEALERAGGIEVAGSVVNGELAVELARVKRFDVVILDIEMPVMDGLTALPRILEASPGLKVIMVSSMTEAGARVTMRALALGAVDFIPKPRASPLCRKVEELAGILVEKVRALGMSRPETTKGIPPDARPVRRRPGVRPDILVIGASTGGPNAVSELFAGLGPCFPLPILLVQHIPPIFSRLLAERYQRETGRSCREAVEGESVRAGHTYVAPGDFHMKVLARGDRMQLALSREDPENYCRPSLDVLVRSVARAYQDRSLLVVLTGMGEDGLRGAGELHRAGGRIFVQDPATSVVWGMPGAIHRAGLSHGMSSIPGLVTEIRKAMTVDATTL